MRRDPSTIGSVAWFHAIGDDAFWVTRGSEPERVVTGKARLELDGTGRVLRAAWTSDDAGAGQLIGAIAVPERLGGGFVHWSQTAVFRSRTFLGALEPVRLGTRDGVVVRGARVGLRSVVVVTDAGPRELAAGASDATASSEPALADTIALDAARAVRLDLFGRASETTDGGRTWTNAAAAVGIAVRGLAVAEGGIALDTWRGRFVFDGALSGPDAQARSPQTDPKAFQPIASSARAGDRDDPWGWRPTSPLASAIGAGAVTADGIAFAAAQSHIARVDPKTGATVAMWSDAIAGGAWCEPLGAPSGVVFACSWEQYQGSGSFVMRSAAGEPPALERIFTDDGYFIADDAGGLAFAGHCRAEPRIADSDLPSRYTSGIGGDPPPPTTICVRKASGEWVERSVELEASSTLLAWAPRVDGSALAIATRGSGPEVRGAARVTEQGGVRVVRVDGTIDRWGWPKAGWRPDVGAHGITSVHIDRRFAARNDGSVDGWMTTDAGESVVVAGASIDEAGHVVVHDPPPGIRATALGADFGLAVASEGALFETVDHGRSWRFAGMSPIAPSAFVGTCSRLGCAVGSLVRVGWHRDASLAVRVEPTPEPPPARPTAARLACTAVGAPRLERDATPPPPGSRSSITTGAGDAIDVFREAGAAEAPTETATPGEPEAPPATKKPQPGGRPAPPAHAAATPKKPAPTRGPRTHVVAYRAPFSTADGEHRIALVEPAFGSPRRSAATPLLSPRGVAFLLFGEGEELLVDGDRATPLPPFDGKRGAFYGDVNASPGVLLPNGHALVLGDRRNRLAIEEHGAGALRAATAIHGDREAPRRRALGIVTRGRGELGVIVLDGDAPESVAAAVFDRATGELGPPERLAAWATARPATDASCAADAASDWRGLVVLHAGWVQLDAAALPGVDVGEQGLAIVRWGRERVCVEAIDIAAIDHVRAERAAGRIVARFDAHAASAALRLPGITQPLRCAIEPQRMPAP